MIYLFDKDEKLIKIVNKQVIKTALQKFVLTEERYVSDRLTVEMRMLDDDELEAVEYMAIQTIEDNHKFHYFYVAQKSSEGTITTLTGVQSGIEELRKSVVLDKRPQDEFARAVIEDLLKDTNWKARFVGETTPHSTNFYYLSTFDALKKVCEVWNLEMQFFVEMNSNKIGARYIDFKQKIGSASGKRVVYGHNALQILQEVERTNIFTALIGRGKGEQVSSAGDVKADGSIQESDGYGRKITIKDVEWSKAAGDPLDKPKGQDYLEWKEMTWQHGIKNADGSMRPKIGFVEFSEEEKPEELIKRVYEVLIDSARPRLTLKTSTVYLKGAFIGDTIRVVRHDKKIDYDTRIFEIMVDRLNDKSSDIKLGDRIAGSESVKAQSQAIANKAIEEFANTEFNNFVKKLPDFIASADGKNTNWGGEEDPTVKYPGKVLINDIWYKPDPEHEGHKIMLRWTGEVWEEILRTGYADIVKERIDKEFQALNEEIEVKDREHNEQINAILSKATSTEELAQQAKLLTADAKLSIESQLSQSRQVLNAVSSQLSQAKQDLLSQAKAQNELTKRTEAVEKMTDSTKTTLTELSKTVNTQTGQIESVSNRTKTVEDGLTGLTTRYENLQSGFSNLILKSDDFENPHKQNGDKTTVTSENDYYVITSAGYTSNAWGGMSWNLAIDEVKAGDTFSLLMPVYIDTTVVLDRGFSLEIKNHTSQVSACSIWFPTDAKNTWFDVSVTFTVTKDMLLGDYPFYLYIVKNGKVRIKPPTLIKGAIKPSGHIKAEEDIREQISEYRQSATENYARLADNVKDVSGKVSIAEAIANQTAGQISQLVKKSDFDPATGRLSTLETSINNQAGEIAKRLTATQVEQTIIGKGYQTKSDVDSNITSRGYITSSALQPYATATTVQNIVKETAGSFERRIEETKTLIPTEYSGNILVDSGSGWYNLHIKPFKISEDMWAGSTYTVTTRWWRDDNSRVNFGLRTDSDGYFQWVDLIYRGSIDAWVATFKLNKNISAGTILEFHTVEQNGRGHASWATLVKGSLPMSIWQPSSKDLVTETKFNQVIENVDGIRRLVGDGTSLSNAIQSAEKFERSISHGGDLYQAIETSKGLAQEVSNVKGFKTQVSQLADSWAIKSLNKAGDVLAALNLNKDGFVVIDSRIVSISGKTYIENGSIKSAAIESLDAGKIKTGTLDADSVKIINLDASEIRGLNAEFIKAKIETTMISWMKGKVIEAQNRNMGIDLNQAKIDMYANSSIVFHSWKNSIYRENNGITSFLNFQDIPYGVTAALGTTSHHVGIVNINNENFGKFAGFMARRNSDFDDYAQIYGDEIQLRHGSDGNQFYFKPNKLLNQSINMNEYINAIKAMASIFSHLVAEGNRFFDLHPNKNLQDIAYREYMTYLHRILPGDKIEI